MRFAPRFKWLLAFTLLITFSSFLLAQENDLNDEDSPEITARVARISFIRGDVQVKRSGENDWEDVSLNLPLVEGDQISTSTNARVEIQFDSQNFLRLAENSTLKIATLRDEGIAVSLNEGMLSLRVFEFEKEKGYFEIDAPQTTVSVQNAGLFRINAVNPEDVRVTASEGGQARVYSDSSSFTLRNGRMATIFLTDDRLGEWETADASRYTDEWDNWVAERDNKLAKLLKDSYYDRYYDRDMYGAEDLNSYGSWSDSDDYGKVWRPHYSSISTYNNWSPYRYGQWRWVNPFGWTWVNDEPWGWATYHHGRWVNDNRGWFWTPYAYHRPKRSWWKPALVVIFNINNDICWYPLSHRDRYNDYNRYYRRNNNSSFGNYRNDKNYNRPDFRRLPENSIVGIRSDEFGRRRNNVRSIPIQTVRQGLEQRPGAIAQLPKFEERRGEFRRNSNSRRIPPTEQSRTGVTERQAGVELDRTLQSERFRGNRQTERNRQSEIFNNGRQNRTETNDSKRTEQTERRNRNSETQNQPNYPNYRTTLPSTGQPSENDTNRRESERQQRRNESQRPVIVPQNNIPENNQRSRNRETNVGETNRTPRVPDNNSNENNQRVRERNNNSNEVNRPPRVRSNEAENKPQEIRPVYVPRNNDENRRSAPPTRSEESQPQVQPRPREERRVEPRREEPRVEPRREQPRQERREEPRVERRPEVQRQEQPRVEQPRREEPRVERRREEPRQETPRVEPRREEPRREQPRPESRREEPRVEQRQEQPRREQPRQEQPRQKETPREEKRAMPPKGRPEKESPVDN